MEYKSEDFVPYYKELKQHALNLTSYRYELAEDIVQNAYLQFHKDMKDIKVSLKGYLHQLIKWQGLNANRTNLGPSFYKNRHELVDWESIVDQSFMNTELYQAYESHSFNNVNSYINLKDIYKVINQIKHKKERMAVTMSIQGYGLIDIASAVGTTKEGARSYTYKGRKKLKQMMMD